MNYHTGGPNLRAGRDRPSCRYAFSAVACCATFPGSIAKPSPLHDPPVHAILKSCDPHPCPLPEGEGGPSTTPMPQGSEAHVSQETGAAAVLRVLKLNQQAVGIREVQLRGPFFRAATVFHSQRDVVHQRSRRALRGSSRLDSIAFESLDHRVRIEIIHTHAQVIDAARGASATRHDELHAVTEAHDRRGWPLIGLDTETKEFLKEFVRACRVGRAISAVAPAAKGEQSFLR